ncbi:MAG: hypothetical protein E7614_03895 [Ruminococcaceae bacterium]|nr:hypothetical protein [Oscillospiraceae bacterium]
MDLFNSNANESEKSFLKNRMRAIFGSTEMLVHGIIKIILALFFIIGGFSSHVAWMGGVFFLLSAASTFLMFSKMQGERKYSPIGAKMYSILTLIESIFIKVYLLTYCVFLLTAMFGWSLFGKATEAAAIPAYKMGFFCIVAIICVLIVFSMVSVYLKQQRKFAENIFDCVDAQLVFFSTERKYAMRSFVYALLVFMYNIFKMLCPSWYRLNVLPAKFAEYLDSGIIIEKYGVFTFLALLLLSVHLVLSGRLAANYMMVVRKLKKKIDERHAS